MERTITEGELLWTPSPEWIVDTNLTRYLHWLERERGLAFADYAALWRWSTTEIEAFWQSIWDWCDIRASVPPMAVLAERRMPGADWFPGARLNYAEHVLRAERPGADALLHLGEDVPLQGYPWSRFASEVRTLATELRRRGVRPGDRVAAYLPNLPQTMVAMLAATAIGAVWASCSPDFGSQGALDRFAQLAPKVLLCVDGYRYGGKAFDRRAELRAIVAKLPSLELVVELRQLGGAAAEPIAPQSVAWDALLDRPPVAAADFAFEQLPFGHPLWVLFSSGTTGLPKAIVHSHGGILLEMQKHLQLLNDFRPGERAFFYTTTGWMMWNFLVSSLLVGACPVLYDGNPAHPAPDVLWQMVQDSRATFFGASPSYVDIMRKAGIVPRERYDLSSLRCIMPAGSPVSPECTAWFYDNVKSNLWVATGSGGTDCCTGLVGGVPTLPVRAGEIQAPALGVAIAAWDDAGQPVVDQVGEMVITQPMPSMPVRFWGDDDGVRYRESYFDTWSGVWRHGDFLRVNERGGCFVLGRSDATLNRQGVRIGTAEIYRALAAVDDVVDGLIVNLDLPGGRFFMPLFVKLRPGSALTPELERRIAAELRRQYTPRHVPDVVVAVPEIPMTLTGKKMEVPVRRILMGLPAERAANRSAMRDPAALDVFTAYARDHGPLYGTATP
ncbi:MAG TPA: acetoacetate--CoA ligase [Rubrivivax sp.]|nr:acetoacetate--CoA ligase [Rubrivivax sp.]